MVPLVISGTTKTENHFSRATLLKTFVASELFSPEKCNLDEHCQKQLYYFCLVWGLHSGVLRLHAWLCAQGSLLEQEDHKGYQGSNPVQLFARQVPNLL